LHHPTLATLLWALGINAALAVLAWRAGSVLVSGAVAGLVLGVVIYLGLSWRGFLVLAAFFVVGSALTRFGYARKEAMGVAEAKRGARGASHALANAGIPALAAIAAWVTGEPIWAVFFTGAFATAAMDTAGSEIGPLYGKRTVSLKTFRAVPPGTEGAVSMEGTLAGVVVAAVVASVAATDRLLGFGAILPVVLGALAGNLYEGILGSRRLLPHMWLNATNTLVGGAAAALLARLLG